MYMLCEFENINIILLYYIDSKKACYAVCLSVSPCICLSMSRHCAIEKFKKTFIELRQILCICFLGGKQVSFQFSNIPMRGGAVIPISAPF